MLINIFSFILVFTIIALAHEFGHLIFAKRAGIRVYELALGFGPRIFSFQKNNTVYAINLIPILGYVKIAGEGESEEDAACPPNELFSAKRPSQKFITLFAGALFNIVFAFVLLSVLFMLFGVPTGLSKEVGAVNKKSPAELAGLLVGDKIISVNGKVFPTMESIISYIHASKDKPLRIVVARKEKEVVINATPKFNNKLKVALLGFSPKPIYKAVNPLLAIYHGLNQTFSLVLMVLIIFFQLITGSVSLADLAGPVGIAQITGKYAQSGLVSLLHFTAFLSINVGVLNLLPIPALDGGRLVFVLIEWIRGKKINPAVENNFNYWGFIALLALMAIVTLNDLLRIFSNR